MNRLMFLRRPFSHRGPALRPVRRVLVLLVILAAGFFVAIAGVAAVDIFAGSNARDVANATFPGPDGEEIAAYVAESRADNAPVVLMFHEWWGLNAEIAELATLLSLDGYTVVVPDVYRGRSASSVPAALALRLTVDMDRVTEDVSAVADAALEQFAGGAGARLAGGGAGALRSDGGAGDRLPVVDGVHERTRAWHAVGGAGEPRPVVDGAPYGSGDRLPARGRLAGGRRAEQPRLALAGFCFGGDVAIEFALSRPELTSATAVFYGGTESDPERLSALRESGPVLGIFGGEDRQISVERVREFENALVEARVSHRIAIYPDVGHAFVQPDALLEDGAASQAWSDLRGFLSENLHPRPVGRLTGPVSSPSRAR